MQRSQRLKTKIEKWISAAKRRRMVSWLIMIERRYPGGWLAMLAHAHHQGAASGAASSPE
jgi:hypothetical protein